ncbi:MAG: zinc-ribbon domain-containing protein [Actinobacteria bacterium]|nr:zinc-ribbon domain-containing protein [Actinomycetota bacterium]
MEQYNPGQIKKFLKQLRQREEQYTYYLGQLAYREGEAGGLSDPTMLDAFQTLKGIKEQIAQWEVSLAQIKASKEAAVRPRCPNCGGEVIRGAIYCPSCGAALAAPPAPGSPAIPVGAPPSASAPVMPGTHVPVPPAATGTTPLPPTSQAGAGVAPQAVVPSPGRSCSQCGAPLDEDAVFCGSCGTRVAAPEAVATMVSPSQVGAAEPATAEGETAPGKTAEGPMEGKPGSVSVQAEHGAGAITPAADTAEGEREGGVEEPAVGTMSAAGETVPEAAQGEPEAGGEGRKADTSAAEAPSGTAEEVSANETIACPSCWTQITDLDARFCPNCGSKVRE